MRVIEAANASPAGTFPLLHQFTGNAIKATDSG